MAKTHFIFLVFLFTGRQIQNSCFISFASAEAGKRKIMVKTEERHVHCYFSRKNITVFKSIYCHKKALKEQSFKGTFFVLTISKKRRLPKTTAQGNMVFYLNIKPWKKLKFIYKSVSKSV